MFLRRFLLITVLAAYAMTASARVTLVAPRAGDRLEGGRDATLSWSAEGLPAHFEEWEAFLSVDGGAFYAVRITPHLDGRVRTFRWRVPNVATSRARILLRVGDETDEHLVELPQTFTIAPRYGVLDFAPGVTDERGEAAIPGGAPSVEWVSSDLVRHQRRDAAASNSPSFTTSLPVDVVAVTSSAAALHVDEAVAPITFRSSRLRCASSPRCRRPLLLLTTRMNV